MTRFTRLTLRAAALFALLLGLRLAAGAPAPGDSPYLSALSDITAGDALATPYCNEKTCAKEPGRGPACVKSGPGVTCTIKTGCFSTTC